MPTEKETQFKTELKALMLKYNAQLVKEEDVGTDKYYFFLWDERSSLYIEDLYEEFK